MYKLARYLDSDVQDLVRVLREQRVDAAALARLFGQALRHSPRSSAQLLFRKQVEHFLRENGRAVWGGAFAADPVLSLFYRAAGIRRSRRGRPRHVPHTCRRTSSTP